MREFGRLDVLISNAGVMLLGPIENAPVEEWERIVHLNLGAFSESLRQEVTGRHVRVALVEPGAVETELTTRLRAEIREQSVQRFANVEQLEADDIADVIMYIVTRPRAGSP